jgi:DNA replication protein DnaC
MTELELLDRERRATERRIRQAKFPVVKTMDSFDFLAIPSLNKTLVLELARCEFLARRENVLLLGNSGTGKTHIALALGLAACQRGHRVRFTTTAALVSELIEARDDEKLLRFQKQIVSYELLIVDELGFVPLSKTGTELLFEMLSQRYERGSTLVTSNLPFQEWTEVPRLGTADRRPAGPAHPPRSHPGDERRQLPPQAEPPQTDAIRRTLNSPPQIPLSLPTSLAYFYSALDTWVAVTYVL